MGERERTEAILKQLQTRSEYVSLVDLATFHVALCEGVDPSLDPLRDDPRFENLLRRVGLPE